jgi:hypothetical protein
LRQVAARVRIRWRSLGPRRPNARSGHLSFCHPGYLAPALLAGLSTWKVAGGRPNRDRENERVPFPSPASNASFEATSPRRSGARCCLLSSLHAPRALSLTSGRRLSPVQKITARNSRARAAWRTRAKQRRCREPAGPRAGGSGNGGNALRDRRNGRRRRRPRSENPLSPPHAVGASGRSAVSHSG